MVLQGQTSNKLWTLDYDKIPLLKVQFLPITFNGDVLFEFPPIHLNACNPSQMQSMHKEYNGHAWCKFITTNIKNSFGLSFRKVCCLDHLRCVQDDCENFVHFATHNETLWCYECAHNPIFGQMIMISSSLLGCKFCHSPPFFVAD
jgi:hypothetical protein